MSVPFAAGFAAERVLAETRAWIDSFVVELGLCPFAGEVVESGRLRIALSEAHGQEAPEALLVDLGSEIDRLLAAQADDVDTTLLVHPSALRDFCEYNAFLDRAEGLVAARSLEGVVQIASFHPDYRFADAPADDPANFTNRSPHPMLHILREASVSRAVDAHPDPASIPSRNARLLRELGAAKLTRRFGRCVDWQTS